jgi:hypothetical protein
MDRQLIFFATDLGLNLADNLSVLSVQAGGLPLP